MASPQSVRENIASAIAGTLDGAAAIAATVERNRSRPVKISDCPLLVVHEGEESDPVEADGVDQLVATFKIEGYVTAATDALLGAAANELHADVIAALKAGTYPSGFLRAARGGCEWRLDEEDGHKPLMSFALDWRVLYAVDPDDPYTAG
jgi:hypothetical protein